MTSGRKLTVGSLFAGIGGIELGLEWTGGFETKWQVECDSYAQRVLAKHWPNVGRWDDVRTFPPSPAEDWQCDVICGGFPCQDISYAGKGAGLSGERSGLFYEVARIVRALEPRYVLLENVAALLTRGLGDVLGTLASLGYDCWWNCLQAADVGAPHLRDRVFIIGYLSDTTKLLGNGSNDHARVGLEGQSVPQSRNGRGPNDVSDPHGCEQGRRVESQRGQVRRDSDIARDGEEWNVADTNRRASDPRRPQPEEQQRQPKTVCDSSKISDAASIGLERAEQQRKWFAVGKRPIHDSWWAVEPDVGRVAHGVPARVDRLRCLGNAVVPQCAQFIGEMILDFERRRDK